MFEQLPASARSSKCELPSDGAGQQGPEGGAAAPSGPPNPHSLGSHQGTPPADAAPFHAPAGGATFAGVPVRAMEDVMACRTRQILEFGHTPERDRLGPLYTQREFDHQGRRSLLRAITHQLASAIEYAAWGPGKHDIVRRYLVKTAALCLAAIDWIDADQAEREAETRNH